MALSSAAGFERNSALLMAAASRSAAVAGNTSHAKKMVAAKHCRSRANGILAGPRKRCPNLRRERLVRKLESGPVLRVALCPWSKRLRDPAAGGGKLATLREGRRTPQPGSKTAPHRVWSRYAGLRRKPREPRPEINLLPGGVFHWGCVVPFGRAASCAPRDLWQALARLRHGPFVVASCPNVQMSQK